MTNPDDGHSDRGPCRRTGCGHLEEKHWHLRPGDDCGTCGRQVCPRYLPTLGAVRAWIARRVGR